MMDVFRFGICGPEMVAVSCYHDDVPQDWGTGYTNLEGETTDFGLDLLLAERVLKAHCI